MPSSPALARSSARRPRDVRSVRGGAPVCRTNILGGLSRRGILSTQAPACASQPSTVPLPLQSTCLVRYQIEGHIAGSEPGHRGGGTPDLAGIRVDLKMSSLHVPQFFGLHGTITARTDGLQGIKESRKSEPVRSQSLTTSVASLRIHSSSSQELQSCCGDFHRFVQKST